MLPSGLRRIFSDDQAPWWAPYLGVVLYAAVAGALVLGFVLLNAPEILRVLRASG